VAYQDTFLVASVYNITDTLASLQAIDPLTAKAKRGGKLGQQSEIFIALEKKRLASFFICLS